MSSKLNFMDLPKIFGYNQSGKKDLNISEDIKITNRNKKSKKLLNFTSTVDSNILYNTSIVTDAPTNCSTEDIIVYRKRINSILKEKKKQYFKEKNHKQKNSKINFYNDFLREKLYKKNHSITISNINKDDSSNFDNNDEKIENSNSMIKSKFNTDIINDYSYINKNYNKLIYLPNLYSQYKINYGSLTKTRQNLLDFNKTSKLIRLNNIIKKNLNYTYLTNIENIEISNSYCDFISFKSNYKLLLLNKYIQTLDNYIKFLKAKIDNESSILSKISFYHIQLRRKKYELITHCEKLIYEKKELCKYKVLLFLIKFDCSNFNELKDKSMLEKYGFNYIPKEYYNYSFDYYDDRNDNSNNNYIKIYNPEIFMNLEEYENCFKLRENRILNLMIKKLKTEFDIPHLNASLDEIKNSIKKSFLFFKNEFENEKEKLRIVVNENNYLNEFLNNVKVLYNKVNEFNQLKFLRKKLKFMINQNYFKYYLKEKLNIDLNKNQKKFVLNKNIISSIIINLNYLEKIINYLVDKDKELKEKFPEKYLKEKNKLNEIKGVIKNKKFIEEMLLNHEKQIKRIFDKNNKIIFKKVHRIEDNLRFSDINPNNHKKKDKNKFVAKKNVNEYENFISY